MRFGDIALIAELPAVDLTW